jgi:hypothetical protein
MHCTHLSHDRSYVSTLVLLCAANAGAQDAAKGASLLAEARQALGGEDKVARREDSPV